ncbi:vWA domain-containing protein [Halostella salina]|uniref:vWA domain-containing protein n=1 Tax=Halostella salina TaxID=1547897 RepID=UPI000EF7AAF0|nr:VWA domain-containing protein [Halostella salina]
MEITPNTSRSALARLSTTDRRSERRREELQRLANVLTDSALQVRVTFQQTGAFAHTAAESDPHDFEIHVPVEKYDQVETDLPEATWDRRVQMGLLFHELGHVLYSDFERFEQRQSEIIPRHRTLFRTLYNAAEDVVIEAQLAREFALEDDFRTLNNTFRQSQQRDHQRYLDQFADEGEDRFTYTVYEALLIGVLEQGFGSDPRFQAIVDPQNQSHHVHGGRRDVVTALADRIPEFIDDLLTLPSGRDRVDRGYEFFETVRDRLVELPTIQSIRIETEPFRPVEAGDYVLNRSERATALPDPTQRTTQPGASGTSPDDTGDHRSNYSPGSGEADQRPVPHSEVSPTSRTTGPHLLLDSDGSTSSLQREAEELLDLVQSSESDLQRVGVTEIDEGDGERQRWEQAKRRAQPLANDLRSSLRRRRRADKQSGHRTGQIDPQQLVSAAHGRDRVFKRRVRGDQRDYSCLLVLDRSGSMVRSKIEAAEIATAQLVHAFHAVGIDVSVLSLWQNIPWLELPFGGAPERFADHIMSGRATGGTPLAETVEIARNRISTGSGDHSFMIVVTDGEPGDTEAFFEQIDRCNFNVYAVYIQGEPGEHAQYFDRIVYTDTGTIDATVRELARQLIS